MCFQLHVALDHFDFFPQLTRKRSRLLYQIANDRKHWRKWRAQLVRKIGNELIFGAIGRARGFLGLDLLSDIGVGAKPKHNATVGIAKRHRPRKMPPELTILTADWKSIFPWFLFLQRCFPAINNARELFRIVDFFPPPALHLFRRRAGEIVPSLIVPKDPSV